MCVYMCVCIYLSLALSLYSFSFIVCCQVMSNQEAVDIARKTRDPQKAAEQLTMAALNKDSKDDISCVVVRFRNSALT